MSTLLRLLGLLGVLVPLAATQSRTAPPALAHEGVIGNLEVVATFNGPMPTGVTVSRTGRIFVNFPRWDDPVEFTVAELKNGQAVPYPNLDMNRLDLHDQENHFISVQSVVVDAKDRLWILDTGSVKMAPTSPGGPKLIGIDLETNRIFAKIVFPPDVALKTSYLNDVRLNLRFGREGAAFITDSSSSGPNAIIVVDLASGKAWRRLHQHVSVRAEPGFVPIVEGERLEMKLPAGNSLPFTVGVDGIAISSDGKTIYYCPLSSRHLYSVSAEALYDVSKNEAYVEGTVEDLGEKGASDGMESDAEGRLYAGDHENDSIFRRNADRSWTTLVHDPRILWPDTLSVAGDGYLYFTVNQLERSPRFHDGEDLRKKPYVLFRTKIDGTPITLK